MGKTLRPNAEDSEGPVRVRVTRKAYGAFQVLRSAATLTYQTASCVKEGAKPTPGRKGRSKRQGEEPAPPIVFSGAAYTTAWLCLEVGMEIGINKNTKDEEGEATSGIVSNVRRSYKRRATDRSATLQWAD